jgi:glycerate kinase
MSALTTSISGTAGTILQRPTRNSTPDGDALAVSSTEAYEEEAILSYAASVRHKPLTILIAPSGFKESLGPEKIAAAIEKGVKNVFKEAIIHKLPLHDGGEGFCKALVAAKHGSLQEVTVVGPVGHYINSHLGFIDDGKTAVLDMAAAAGLRLVPKSMRDPTVTTTYGVGQLVLLALNRGCRKVIIGCGDSGTCDGGAGMLQALGVKLLNKSGSELPLASGGRSLIELDSISWADIHPRLRADAGKECL